MRKLKRTHQ